MNPIVPQPWLERLESRVRAPREQLDAEAVHELRVAAGRLRVWLQLGGVRVLQDDLRWLRRSASALRDLDVVLERGVKKPWARELPARREMLAADLAGALADARLRGLLQSFAILPHVTEDSARDRAAKFKKRTLRVGERALKHGEDLERVHRLRRSVRRLRYAVEWLEDESRPLADLQGALGELGDLATVERYLAGRPDPDGFEADRRAIEREVAEQRDRVLAAWRESRDDVEAL